jgi:hypothetical protein
MLNAVGAVGFVGFLLAVMAVAAAERLRPAWRPTAVNALLLYTMAVSSAAGLAQRDAWPFAKWPMAGGLADAEAENTRLVAVDAAGAEHSIDYRAWQPLGFDELNPWMHRTFPRLSPAEQQRVAAFLLAVAEGSRQRAAAGRGVGYFHRYLGPLAAPNFDLHPESWRAGAPPVPFRGLRVYRERWNQERRRRDPAQVERRLAYEYAQP